MAEIIRHLIHDDNANSGVIVAGDYVFIGHCCRNQGQVLEKQIIGALDQLSEGCLSNTSYGGSIQRAI